jgi:hypothetical protein
MMDANSGPRLIDQSAKNYLYNTLQACHQTRVKYHSILLNGFVFIAFVGCASLILYYLYRRKPTAEQTRQQIEQDQQFILSKIRFYQEQNQKIRESASPITGLPALPVRDF